jgi:replicative DNA helicase
MENHPSSDLRESGSIEQDADVVGLLVHAEYYETDEEAKQDVAGEAPVDHRKTAQRADRRCALGLSA